MNFQNTLTLISISKGQMKKLKHVKLQNGNQSIMCTLLMLNASVDLCAYLFVV